MEKLKEFFEAEYPIEIHRIKEKDDSGYYYVASLPDFGASTCSAVGETKVEALEALEGVKESVFQYYKNTGKEFPRPSKSTLEAEALQQMPIRITKELHNRLQRAAEQNGQSLNAYVTVILTEHMTIDAMQSALSNMVKDCKKMLEKDFLAKISEYYIPMVGSGQLIGSIGMKKTKPHLTIVDESNPEQIFHATAWEK